MHGIETHGELFKFLLFYFWVSFCEISYIGFAVFCCTIKLLLWKRKKLEISVWQCLWNVEGLRVKLLKEVKIN